MKFPDIRLTGTPQAATSRRGFALVATLSLMVLLVMVGVGLLTLSSVSLRCTSAGEANSIARANARMALILALGELQKRTGPDQRITLNAGIPMGGSQSEPINPAWTGAVDVREASPTSKTKDATVSWLVSGRKPDPSARLAESADPRNGNALRLGTYHLSDGKTVDSLLAPLVNITSGPGKGRIAWWIGDEGAKARVDVAEPAAAPTSERERLARSQSPLEAGLVNLGDDWKSFDPKGKINKAKLVSIPTTALATGDLKLASKYFNDLTTGGFGLPVNVVDGGMKIDLSTVFDRNRNFSERYLGAKAGPATVNQAKFNAFTVTDPKKFYLSETISRNGSLATGPNWGILWNYANLWQNVSGQEAALVGINPMVKTDVRFKDWLPYTNSDRSNGDNNNWRKDEQHTNSGLTPVVSMLQMGFRLSSEKVPRENPTDPVYFKAQITMQPVLGIWNPYNVPIKAATYRFDWALYPYFRFNYAKPLGNGKYTDSKLTELWLREVWIEDPSDPSKFIPSDSNPKASCLFRLDTDPVDLQPGEFRLFSAVDKTMVTSKTLHSHKLKAGWSENGGFVVNLKDKDGKDRLVPSGHRAWFGDIVLQDVQSAETKKRWPTLDTTKLAAGYVVLKALNPGETVIYRATELWNGSNTSGLKVPEPVVSGSTGGLDTTKTTYLIDDLEGDRVLAHIATWSFFNRTTLQTEEANQRLRGWIDANPRSIATNPAWDGSTVAADGSNRAGWHTTSQFIGAYNPPGKPKQIGDGSGGNRGLLGEGGSAVFEPEVNAKGGRYQGFGGAATTNAGKNHVIVFDVPRSPLVSIGQFQHAQLSRYNFEPGFVVGNSYANVRIPLGQTVNRNFAGTSNLNIVDTSHEVNRALWDKFFFSTLALDYKASGGNKLDGAFNLNRLASGEESLPNPRMSFFPARGDTSLDKLVSNPSGRGPEALAARIMINGAFNVNSTSKTAWMAVLSSMGASQLPVINPTTGAATWKKPTGVRFNRFGRVASDTSYQKGGSGEDPAFWRGWRELSADELDQLAEQIVIEVKERGPFRSLAEFVNRNPYSNKVDHQRKGVLQAAIDRTVNAGLPGSIGKPATSPQGRHFSANVPAGENQATGHASYLLQGDVLQSLAPILQVRSDYFRIRTCGEAVDAKGKVTARAWCEAYVQRVGDYCDPNDAGDTASGDLTSDVNKNFGRAFRIVSFRWLSSAEIQPSRI